MRPYSPALAMVTPLMIIMPMTAAAPVQGQDGSDQAAGERAFQYCYSCHSVDPRETGLPGPNLAGIVDARVASRDFDYSPALKSFAMDHPVWSEALLDRFITDPEELIPGTAMAFHGIRHPEERAALIAYLKASVPRG